MRRRGALGLAAYLALALAAAAGLLEVWRYPARLRCHGSVLCCQRVDLPRCNGPLEPHLLVERYRRWRRCMRFGS